MPCRFQYHVMRSERLSRIIAIALVAGTALLIVWVAAERFSRRGVPHVDIDRSEYPVVGIDLSAHNGKVDFDSIRRSGVDFVFLKASEGVSLQDPRFYSNYVAARRAGLAVGAYHFFRFDCDGRRQAMNLMRVIRSVSIDLPVAIDVEEWSNPAEVPTDIIVARLQAMSDHLEANGHPTMFYTNKNGVGRFLRDNFDDRPLWICSFTDPPLSHRDWLFWQHSHCGRIAGVKGDVDMNTFNGSHRALNQYIDSLRLSR